LISEVLKRAALRLKPRIVFSDGENSEVICAASNLALEHFAVPILIGSNEKINKIANNQNLMLDGVEIITPSKSHLFSHFLNKSVEKHGRAKQVEKEIRSTEYFATMMLETGEVDAAIVSGDKRTFYQNAIKIIGRKAENPRVSAHTILHSPSRTFVISDTFFPFEPTASSLAEIASSSIKMQRKMFKSNGRIVFLYESEILTNAPTQSICKNAQKIFHHFYQNVEVVCEEIENFPKIIYNMPIEYDTFVFPNHSLAYLTAQIVNQIHGYELIGPIIYGLNFPYYFQNATMKADEIFRLALSIASSQLKK